MTLAEVIPLPFIAERLALQERIGEKRRELEDAEALAEGLCDGTIHWSQYDETYTCPDRQQAAYEDAAACADQVRAELRELEAQAEPPCPDCGAPARHSCEAGCMRYRDNDMGEPR
jgi:hypothetical protein